MIDRLIRSRVHWFLFVGFALFAIACTSAPTATPRPTSTPVPTTAPTPPATTAATNTPVPPPATQAPVIAPAAVIGSGIEGGDPDFNAAALIWQGYWLSRNHFGPFVMASGMGIPFMPSKEMMQAR